MNIIIMKNINEYSEKAGALFLIEQHTIGNLRDEGDLDNAKYHAEQTVNFVEDLLLNIDGTIEEKLNNLISDDKRKELEFESILKDFSK